MFPLTHHRHVMLNNQVISSFLGKVDCIHNNRILAILRTKLSRGSWVVTYHPPIMPQSISTNCFEPKSYLKISYLEWKEKSEQKQVRSDLFFPQDFPTTHLKTCLSCSILWTSTFHLPLCRYGSRRCPHWSWLCTRSLQNLTTNKKILKRWFKAKVNSFQLTFFSQTKKTPGIAASSFNPASGPRSARCWFRVQTLMERTQAMKDHL